MIRKGLKQSQIMFSYRHVFRGQRHTLGLPSLNSQRTSRPYPPLGSSWTALHYPFPRQGSGPQLYPHSLQHQRMKPADCPDEGASLPRSTVLKLYCASESSAGSASTGPKGGPRICISSKFPDDVDPHTTMRISALAIN